MNAPHWPASEFKLDIGDQIPNISGPDQHGRHFSILMAPPGPFAVLSAESKDSAAANAALKAFEAAVQTAGPTQPNAAIALVGTADLAYGLARSLHLETSVLADTRGDLAVLFRAKRENQAGTTAPRANILALVTDPDRSIRFVVPFTSTSEFKAAIKSAICEAAIPGQRRNDKGFVPVLSIPRLLSPAQCRMLITTWEASHQSGKVGKTSLFGEPVNEAAQRRVCYDHFCNKALHAQIVATLGPRIQEAVRQAFQFNIQHYEPFFVVAYPASEGGHFAPHRDNLDPAHMHRRFAVTVNLNTGDYEGGGIWFPEFADMVYDPAAGDGVLFSCSLLHEAKVVTKGTRFILSGFMWGAADEALRQRNAQGAAARRQQSAPLA